MAAGKIFAISFAINAMMGGSFAATMSRSASLMSSLQAKTKSFNAEQSQLNQKIQSTNGYINAYKSRIAMLSQQYTSGKISLSQYSAEIQMTRQRMEEAGASVTAYKNRIAALEQETGKAKAKMQEFQKIQAARQAASSKMSTAWAGLQSSAATGMMVAAPLVGAIETAANFEAAMSKVKAITRSSDAEMQKLNENARMLGATTQFSAIQAADAMSYLGMAGWNSSQIIAGMPGLLSLAAAGGTDLARTADIVSDDLTAFGLSADQAGHMADVFAVTVTRTNTNVEMLGETMKYAAPVAKAFGASMEETSALAGLMANSGIKASQAGTALRSGFLRLAGPPKMAQKALDKLGISLSDVTAQQQEAQAALAALGISMSDMQGPHKMSAILTELRDKLQGLGKEEKLAQLKAIFGTEAATGWLAVLDAGPETFNKLVTEMEHCDGEAKKMADTMMNNAKGSWIQLKSALEGLAISVGTIFLPALTSAGKGAAEIVGSLANWVPQHQQLVTGIMGVAGALASIMPMYYAYNLLGAGINYVGETLRAFKMTVMESKAVEVAASAATSIHAASTAALGAAMNFVQHPILTTKAALSALKAQLLATRAVQLASAAATTIHAAAVTFFGTAVAMLQNPGMATLGMLYRLKTGIAAVETAAVNAPGKMLTAFKALPGLIGGALMPVLSVGLPVIAIIAAIAAVALLIAANFDKIKETATIVFNHISGTVSAWVARLQAAFQTALVTITNVWNSVTGQTMQSSQMIGFIINNIGFVIGAAFDIAAGVVGTAISVIINLVAAMAQLIGGFVNFIAGVLTLDWNRAWTGAAQVFDGLFDGTIGTFKTIADGVGGIFDTLMGKADEAQKKAEEVKNSAKVEGGADDADSFAVANAQQMAAATGEAAGSAQQLSSNMQQAGANTQQTSGSLQQMQSLLQQVPGMTQNAFAGMGDQSALAAQAVSTNLQQIPTQTQAVFDQIPQQAQAAMQQVPTQMQGNFDQMGPMAQQSVDAIAAEYAQLAAKCQPGGEAFVQAAGTWGQNACASISQWADQMANAVQTKLSNAWQNIQSQFSAGLNVNVTTTNTVVTKEVKQNARGGIYRKGAFLTTFAEESPEAAIPLDGSKRAVDLWHMAGKILGVDMGDDDKERGSTPSFMPAPKFNVSEVSPGKEMPAPSAERASTPVPAKDNDISVSMPEPVHANDAPVAMPESALANNTSVVMPAINLTLNFYGEQQPKEVRTAVLDATRKVQKSFAEQMREFERERGRLAYD